MRIEPYKHDCSECVWVGWYSEKDGSLSNIYVCPEEHSPTGVTVVIRHSSEPSNYWSGSTGSKPHAIEALSN